MLGPNAVKDTVSPRSFPSLPSRFVFLLFNQYVLFHCARSAAVVPCDLSFFLRRGAGAVCFPRPGDTLVTLFFLAPCFEQLPVWLPRPCSSPLRPCWRRLRRRAGQ